MATPPCENAVAGGVDSMLTLKQTIEAEVPSRRLTHLMITGNGSLEGEDNSALLKQLIQTAKNGIAAELGIPAAGIDSNIQEIVGENFLSVVVYRHASVVLARQKLFGVSYNSSSYPWHIDICIPAFNRCRSTAAIGAESASA